MHLSIRNRFSRIPSDYTVLPKTLKTNRHSSGIDTTLPPVASDSNMTPKPEKNKSRGIAPLVIAAIAIACGVIAAAVVGIIIAIPILNDRVFPALHVVHKPRKRDNTTDNIY